MPSQRQPKLDFALNLDFSRILTNPILDIAARVWDDDRYVAFKTCYRSMRRIDDLVDHRKASGQPISRDEALQFERLVAEWLEGALRGTANDQFQKEFLNVIVRFSIPLWPWERLCSAMIYDLHHDGFTTFHRFLRYTEGAAIAPASVFMHLCGITAQHGGFESPRFDIRLAARHLAIFSYLVHILRDWQKDHREHLNYFSDDLLADCGLSVPMIRTMANGEDITDEFRSLVARYLEIAEYYRIRARATIDLTLPLLAPRYQLSLELIYQLYLQIYERLDPDGELQAADSLAPPPAEVQARIDQTIAEFRPVAE